MAPLSGRERVAFWSERERAAENVFLEEVEGKEAMGWVKSRNRRILESFGDPKEELLYTKVLSIFESKDKIPHIRKIGGFYYNFWIDGVNPRGLWRRTSLESFCDKSIVGSNGVLWETVLDIDALGKEEGESWVWAGHTPFLPDHYHRAKDDNKEEEEEPTVTRTLIKLSKGGSDATVMREFDLVTKQFVTSSDAFILRNPAKSRVSWLSKDTLLLGTNVDGIVDGLATSSMTKSGYPRIVLRWSRGTPLSSAQLDFEGDETDVAVTGYLFKHCGHKVEWRCRSLTFYTSKYWVRFENEVTWHALPLQEDAGVLSFRDQLLITLRSDWIVKGSNGEDDITYASGSVLAISLRDLTASSLEKIQVLFTPSARTALDSITTTMNMVLIHCLDEVKSRLCFWRYNSDENASKLRFSDEGSEVDATIRGLSLSADDNDHNDLVWVTLSTFLTPSSLFLINSASGPESIKQATTHRVDPIKSLPMQFNATNLEELQFEAISSDGERIPYFIIRTKGLPKKEKTPTLLYAYGGFEISLLPNYLGATGLAWLEEGNTYVIANIRGGGEFANWHKAALKENRKLAYDDLIAVAEALIATKQASSSHLGVRGGSNGGLLVGNMYVRRPDLFNAVICQVPLLDMKRYSKLLAGASWMGEYGDPDTADWDFLQKYSPYHNIDPTGLTKYPNLLITTSMKDDRYSLALSSSFL